MTTRSQNPSPHSGAQPVLEHLNEAQFQNLVINTALAYGWRVTHYRPSLRRSGGYSTALQGHKGCPDLILARAGDVLLAELKTAKGTPSPDQKLWLTALGRYGRLWRPADWPQIAHTLKNGPDQETS